MLSKIHTGIMCAQLSKKSTIGSQFLGCHWVTIFRTKGIQTSHISLREKDKAGWLTALPGLTVCKGHQHPHLPNKEEKGTAWRPGQKAIGPVPTLARPAPASSLLSWPPTQPGALILGSACLPGTVAVGSHRLVSPAQWPLATCRVLFHPELSAQLTLLDFGLQI